MVNLLLNFLFRRNISSETSGKLKKFLALANDIRRPSLKHFEQNALGVTKSCSGCSGPN